MFRWDEHLSKDEVEFIMIKTLVNPFGLTRHPWGWSRGAKTHREYTKPTHDNASEFDAIVVEYVYEYYKDDQGNDDLRKIKTYEERIHIYNEDGTKFHEIDVPASLNIKNISSINREIRQGQIDYLEDAATKLTDQADALPATPDAPTLAVMIGSGAFPASVVDLATYHAFRDGLYYIAAQLDNMFAHWKVEVDEYIARGKDSFEQAVINEDDPVFLNILAQVARTPDADFPVGLTVRQSIMYQLTGVKP